MPNGGHGDPIYDALLAASVNVRYRVEVGDVGEAVTGALGRAEALVVGLFAGVTQFSGAVQALDEACERRLGPATREAPEGPGALGSVAGVRVSRNSWAVALGLGPQQELDAIRLEAALQGLAEWLDEHPAVRRLTLVPLGTANAQVTLRDFAQTLTWSFTVEQGGRVCDLRGQLEHVVLLERDPERAQRLELLVREAMAGLEAKLQDQERESYLVFHSPHDPYRRRRRVPRWFDTDPEKYRRMFMATLQGMLFGASLEKRLRAEPPEADAAQVAADFLAAPEPVDKSVLRFVTAAAHRAMGQSDVSLRYLYETDDYGLQAGVEAIPIALLSLHEDDGEVLADRVLRALPAADDGSRGAALASAAASWHVLRYFQDIDVGHQVTTIVALTLDAAPETSAAFRRLLELVSPTTGSRERLLEAVAADRPRTPLLTLYAYALTAPDLPSLLREAAPAIGDVAHALPLAAALGGTRMSLAGIPQPLAYMVDPQGEAPKLANELLSHWQASTKELRPR